MISEYKGIALLWKSNRRVCQNFNEIVTSINWHNGGINNNFCAIINNGYTKSSRNKAARQTAQFQTTIRLLIWISFRRNPHKLSGHQCHHKMQAHLHWPNNNHINIMPKISIMIMMMIIPWKRSTIFIAQLSIQIRHITHHFRWSWVEIDLHR